MEVRLYRVKMTMSSQTLSSAQLQRLQQATRTHLRQHGCGAYTFEDGAGLIQLAQTLRPQRVLELGTALGFSACCFAQASETTQVDTIEADSEHVQLAREQIASVGLRDRITVHHGYFEEVLPTLSAGYDLVFFDGFEPSMAILSTLREKLVIGGVLVCANTSLSSGRERRALESYLNDNKLWERKDSLEQGRTLVRVKC
ncbi:MAG: hypothetical protein E6Q83_06200 [Thiothrix sp.]|nr:MAG: hypothetical protein E6Q83_06200 [Thiothrix sp.]